jgi:hypothetical protein
MLQPSTLQLWLQLLLRARFRAFNVSSPASEQLCIVVAAGRPGSDPGCRE